MQVTLTMGMRNAEGIAGGPPAAIMREQLQDIGSVVCAVFYVQSMWISVFQDK